MPISRAVRAMQSHCDSWLGWAYYPLSCALLAAMALYTHWFAGKVSADWEQWVVADWLVSYAPGFVRRGLSGQLLLGVSRLTSAPANIVVWWTIVAVFAIFAVALAALLWQKRMTFWYFVLCCSPASLLFALYNPPAVGRKEGLLIAAFAVWALVLARAPLTRTIAATFGVAAVALTLMHELFAFYSPYFVVLAYLTSARNAREEPLRWAAMVPAGALMALGATIASPISLNEPSLCERLLQAGAHPRVCEGLLEYHQPPPGQALLAAASLSSQAIATGLSAVLVMVLVPLWCFAAANVPLQWQRRRLMGGAVAAIAWSVPLFLVAVDWGRWIAIHATMTALLCAPLLPMRRELAAPRLATPGALVSVAAGVLLLASMLAWSPKYCCGSDLVTDYTPVEAITATWADFEF